MLIKGLVQPRAESQKIDFCILTKDKKIISNMDNVVMYDGIDELNVNLDIISTKYETKNVKIIYYF